MFLVLIVWIAVARLRPPTQAPAAASHPEPEVDGQVVRLR
jgi:hypothetical protein